MRESLAYLLSKLYIVRISIWLWKCGHRLGSQEGLFLNVYPLSCPNTIGICWGWGLPHTKKCHTIYSNFVFLLSSNFPEFIGQFLQPPAWAHIQAKPSLSSSLWYGYNKFILGFGNINLMLIYPSNWPRAATSITESFHSCRCQ